MVTILVLTLGLLRSGDGRTHFVDPVVDSSRYWVIRLSAGGRDQLIGVGLEKRDDAELFRNAVDESVRFMHRAAKADAMATEVRARARQG